jgi:hypothetical protein
VKKAVEIVNETAISLIFPKQIRAFDRAINGFLTANSDSIIRIFLAGKDQAKISFVVVDRHSFAKGALQRSPSNINS